MTIVLWIHAFSCWFMTGVIWVIQILIYPSFKLLGEKEFSKFHQLHMKKITWIVLPAMLLELATATCLFLGSRSQLFLWNFIYIVLIFLLTFLLNVPTHNKLKFDSETSKNNLVSRNWPRTIIWSWKALFLLFIILSYPFGEVP